MTRKHSHYHKAVGHLESIDVYRVIELFGVTDGAAQHALKKLLCAGQRGNKTFEQDIREAYDTLARRLQMFEEDAPKSVDTTCKADPMAEFPAPTFVPPGPISSGSAMGCKICGDKLGHFGTGCPKMQLQTSFAIPSSVPAPTARDLRTKCHNSRCLQPSMLDSNFCEAHTLTADAGQPPAYDGHD